MSWSPNDTKTQLLEVAMERGLAVSSSMLKADIIAMLESSDPIDPSSVTPVDTPIVKPEPPVSDVLVRDFLEVSSGPQTLQEIADGLGLDVIDVKKALLKLQKEQRVTVYRRGSSVKFTV